MKTTSSAATLANPAARSERASFLARQVLRGLAQLRSGVLLVHEAGRQHRFGHPLPGCPEAELRVEDERFWSAVALRGSVGAGEAYAEGWWTSPDPVAVVRLFVRNQETLDGMEGGLARLSKPFLSLYHRLRRNTEGGSRSNIAAHYDLSNEFFGLFLDDTMTYSCGIFEDEETSLREASLAKIDRLCRKLELSQGDHLLEIGTGWGAFAIHAAREYGCRVTTTTISREQHAVAAERIRAAGLEERVTLVLEDYRRLEGQYDKLVSVEMIEAVGAEYYGDFFASCARLLKPQGLMALQAITISDRHFERARRSVDFIQRHIFPGSCIPSVTALLSASTEASDLRLVHLEDIGPHYVRTLAEWRTRLHERWDEAQTLGFDERFLKLWEFYLVYCEGGFAERHIGNAQMVLARPEARNAPLLPSLGG